MTRIMSMMLQYVARCLGGRIEETGRDREGIADTRFTWAVAKRTSPISSTFVRSNHHERLLVQLLTQIWSLHYLSKADSSFARCVHS